MRTNCSFSYATLRLVYKTRSRILNSSIFRKTSLTEVQCTSETYVMSVWPCCKSTRSCDTVLTPSVMKTSPLLRFGGAPAASRESRPGARMRAARVLARLSRAPYIAVIVLRIISRLFPESYRFIVLRQLSGALIVARRTACERIVECAQCPLLPTIKNGFVVNIGKDYFFGDEVRVQCNRGYKLTGSNIIQCGPYQRFDNVPTCEDINECASSQCDLASTECINNPGAFTCKCKSGFAPTMECRPIGYLGLINGGIPDESITVSSSENGYTKTGIRLNNGFRTQVVARIDGNIAYASAVRIQYTNDLTDVFKDYTNPDGTPVEFRVLDATLSILNLPVPIEARYVRFRIQDYNGAPCMKLEIMGCTRLECSDINECAIRNGGCHQKCINSPVK